MDAAANTERLGLYVHKVLEAPVFGVAKTEKLWFHPDVEFLRDKFPFAVVFGYKVSYAVTSTLVDGPNLLYFNHYRQLNYLLDRSALRVVEWIELQGFNALHVPASQTVDWERQWGHFSHRHAAVEAGVAFWGRNNLAVTPQFGSHVRFVSVLTDMELVPGKPLAMDCGTCRRCIDSCPAGALGETREEWDHQKCFEMLKEFTKRGMGHYICGMCIKPCRGRLG